MSRNSQGRDAYEAKLVGKDATETMRLLMASPYLKHRMRAKRVLMAAEVIDRIRQENPEMIGELKQSLLGPAEEVRDAATTI